MPINTEAFITISLLTAEMNDRETSETVEPTNSLNFPVAAH